MKNLLGYIGLVMVLSLTSCGECRKIECENDGFCSDGECICTKWYSGESCELSYNRNYVGTYYGALDIENGVELRTTDSLSFTSGSKPNSLECEFGFELEFVSDSVLVIPAQELNTTTTTILYEGTGKYHSGYLNFSYDQTDLNSGEVKHVSFEGQRYDKEG